MGILANKSLQWGNYSRRNLQNAIFEGDDLQGADFSGSDLRGANFTRADLTGANLSHTKIGITPLYTVLFFLAALVVSLLSGYMAMLAGQTVQIMLQSNDWNMRSAGMITLGVTVIFILFSIWKGVGRAIKYLIIPFVVLAFIVGITGLGTGGGWIYVILALVLVAVMFYVGTAARAAAGSLSSNILFVVVALGGGLFGKSLGGGIGTVVMAISCAVISKRALGGAEGFDSLRKIASFITKRFGTSFRNACLKQTDFTGSKIRNADFTNAEVSDGNWKETKKINCLINEPEASERIFHGH